MIAVGSNPALASFAAASNGSMDCPATAHSRSNTTTARAGAHRSRVLLARRPPSRRGLEGRNIPPDHALMMRRAKFIEGDSMGVTKHLTAAVLAVAVAAGAASLATAADEEAVRAVKARQDMMKSIGGNVKGLREMLQGKNTESAADAQRRADEIAEAARQIAVLFKSEYHISNVGDIETAAKPELWTDYDDFTSKAEALEAASGELALAAQGGEMDAIKTAFADMSKTCGGCHQTYRVKKN